ncbi:MAG: ATP-grasp domain-containing protein [Pseudomonadota bacterium]
MSEAAIHVTGLHAFMSATVLLTLGRLPKGLDIARSFHALGWRVVIAEPFGWHLCALSRSVARSYQIAAPNDDPAGFRRDLSRIIEREDVDLIIPVSEEIVHVSAAVSALGKASLFFGQKPEDLLKLHDKFAFARLLEAAGLPYPHTELGGSDEADRMLKGRACVIKDRFGASGINIRFTSPGEVAGPINEDSLVQERLVGTELSTFSIVHAGKVSATVVYQPVIRDATVATVFERLAIDHPHARAAAEFIDAVAAFTGHSGFLSFDLMIDEGGRAVAFECNPRANSGIHFLVEADIARAIVHGDVRPRFDAADRMQQAFPTLTLLWGSFGRWPRYREIGAALFSAKDVSWSWRDPLPFILMTPAAWPVLRQSIFEGRSLGEAAIRDIGWFGPPAKALRSSDEAATNQVESPDHQHDQRDLSK